LFFPNQGGPVLSVAKKPFSLMREMGIYLLLFLAGLMRKLKPGRLLLIAISFAAYGLFTTWQFGLLLIVILATHEYGHVWALRRLGLGSRGVFFIPLLGAVTTFENLPATRKADAIVAIAGPAAGAVFAVFLAVLYRITGEPLLAAAAYWAAAINLLNLFPIGLLDGGHVLKAVAFSVSPRKQVPTLFCGLLAASFITVWISPELLGNLLGFGLFWVVLVRGTMRRVRRMGRAGGDVYDQDDPGLKPPMTSPASLGTIIAYAGLALFLAEFMLTMRHYSGVSAAIHALTG
jgi:Zn-dependent protease